MHAQNASRYQYDPDKRSFIDGTKKITKQIHQDSFLHVISIFSEVTTIEMQRIPPIIHP